MKGWLTPDSYPVGTRVIKLEIPTGEEWESVIKGALLPLFDLENYEQYGSLTPQETADKMTEILFDSWAAWEDC